LLHATPCHTHACSIPHFRKRRNTWQKRRSGLGSFKSFNDGCITCVQSIISLA
jgi:hypothetical protein